MYAIVKCVNGAYSIHAEGFAEKQQAIVNFHDVCRTLWSAEDVVTATVMLVDEDLNWLDGYKESINKK